MYQARKQFHQTIKQKGHSPQQPPFLPLGAKKGSGQKKLLIWESTEVFEVRGSGFALLFVFAPRRRKYNKTKNILWSQHPCSPGATSSLKSTVFSLTNAFGLMCSIARLHRYPNRYQPGCLHFRGDPLIDTGLEIDWFSTWTWWSFDTLQTNPHSRLRHSAHRRALPLPTNWHASVHHYIPQNFRLKSVYGVGRKKTLSE